MMSSAKVEFCRLERPVELYENERMWIGRGFSRAGLLPTERGPYSTGDGSLSWKTLPEAGLALLRGEVVAVGDGKGTCASGTVPAKRIRRGWSFREEDGDRTIGRSNYDREDLRLEDAYECSAENGNGGNVPAEYCGFAPCFRPEDGPTDVEYGWQYFPDFSPQSMSKSPNRKRGMLDFVRRRKLRRVAIFRPDHFLPQEVYAKCDYCDSRIVDMLSSAILDALALATLFAHGPKNTITDAQALPLKSKLVDSLFIGHNCSYGTNDGEDHDPWADIVKVKDRLCNFAETCVGKPGPLAHLVDPDLHTKLILSMPERRKLMARYLSDRERQSLARLLIKDVDRYSFKFHCRYESCACTGESNGGSGHDEEDNLCEFRLVPCPNPNCSDLFSYKHRDEHDGECGFKLVPCPNECGAMVPRNGTHLHVRDQCMLRNAVCPLSIVGCTAIVRAKDVATHLTDHADQHFILVANRMMEYQTVMKDMNARIRALEEKNGQLEGELKRTTAQLQSKSEARAVSNNVNKLTKRLGTLETTCRKEFKNLRR